MADCGCRKNGAIKYDVTIPGQPPQRVDTATEALSILAAAGKPAGSAFAAVSA